MRCSFAFVVALWLAIACSSDDSNPGTTATGGAGGADASTGGGAGADAALAPYSVSAFDAIRIQSKSELPNFQRASATVDFGSGPFQTATLVVDLATTCFPFEKWKTNPPPAGENWPADCDAFDRNFEFVLDRPADPKLGPPGVELVRAITPFGGPMHLEIDVTDVVNGRTGKHTLDVEIGTWSDAAGKVSGSNGGWNVTARIDLVPGTPPRKVLAVLPLFDHSNGDPAPLSPVPFTVPAGSTATRLEYRVTGHGGVTGAAGCGLAPAEEFCARTHVIYVDEVELDSVTPWRDDCATLCTIAHQDGANGGFDYCKENPCGAIPSVKAPRANWCPGSVTPPLVWEPPALLTPGPHSFRYQVDDIASGGSWRVSAVLFAFGD